MLAEGAPARRRRWWSIQPPPQHWPVISARRAYAEVLGVYAVFFAGAVAAAIFSAAGHTPSDNINRWSQAVPASIGQLGLTALVIAVPVLLANRRQLGRGDLGLAVHQRVTIRSGIRMAAWALLGFIAGSGITAALQTGNFPYGQFSYPQLTVNLTVGAQAGFIEEIVVLAFVITTLEQARRPFREIVLVAVVLRVLYHLYYGPGAIGVIVWASVFIWLFLRFRTIVPLIVVHSLWDILAFLAHQWNGVAVADGLIWFALLITAVVVWLIDRSDAKQRGRTLFSPPGWYPDPSGAARWRWWTGTAWGPTAPLSAGEGPPQ